MNKYSRDTIKINRRGLFRKSTWVGVVKDPHYGWVRPVTLAQVGKPESFGVYMETPLWYAIQNSPRGFMTRNSPCVCGSGKRFKRCHG